MCVVAGWGSAAHASGQRPQSGGGELRERVEWARRDSGIIAASNFQSLGSGGRAKKNWCLQ